MKAKWFGAAALGLMLASGQMANAGIISSIKHGVEDVGKGIKKGAEKVGSTVKKGATAVKDKVVTGAIVVAGGAIAVKDKIKEKVTGKKPETESTETGPATYETPAKPDPAAVSTY